MDNLKTKQKLLETLYARYIDSQILLVQGGSDRIIFGEGDINAKLMLIGEAPGAKEDELQRPFVGQSGKLLDSLLLAAEYPRENVFITNIIKVRPPDNRKPSTEELKRSRDLLIKQIEIIQPKVICTLGTSALEGLLDQKNSITTLRGTFIPIFETLLMPTFHPAYILRDKKKKPILAEDIANAIKRATA